METKKPTLEEIATIFRGKGGGLEAESIINDSNFEKKEGYVSVWSNKADAAKIIDRCKKGIKVYSLVGDGVQLTIDRKYFRGLVCAFRNVK